MFGRLSLRYFARTAMTRAGSEMPGGDSRAWFTRPKMAEFAPIPSASTAMAVRLNTGFRPSARTATRKSCSIVSPNVTDVWGHL